MRRTASDVLKANEEAYSKMGMAMDKTILELEAAGVPLALANKIVFDIFEQTTLEMTKGLRQQNDNA